MTWTYQRWLSSWPAPLSQKPPSLVDPITSQGTPYMSLISYMNSYDSWLQPWIRGYKGSRWFFFALLACFCRFSQTLARFCNTVLSATFCRKKNCFCKCCFLLAAFSMFSQLSQFALCWCLSVPFVQATGGELRKAQFRQGEQVMLRGVLDWGRCATRDEQIWASES